MSDDERLEQVKLDPAQRERAERLIDKVEVDPDQAAWEIISLRVRLERAEAERERLHEINTRLIAEVAEYTHSFQLFDSAMRRATKLWQEATGQEEVWPDGAKLAAFLIGRVKAAEARIAELEGALRAALNELGVPQPGYPMPVANAVAILRALLEKGKR